MPKGTPSQQVPSRSGRQVPEAPYRSYVKDGDGIYHETDAPNALVGLQISAGSSPIVHLFRAPSGKAEQAIAGLSFESNIVFQILAAHTLLAANRERRPDAKLGLVLVFGKDGPELGLAPARQVD